MGVLKTEQFSLIESPAAGYVGLGQQFEKAFSVGKKLLIWCHHEPTRVTRAVFDATFIKAET